jgi:hypothetical protein
MCGGIEPRMGANEHEDLAARGRKTVIRWKNFFAFFAFFAVNLMA